MSWGCFHLTVRGKVKRTTLRTKTSLYYGDGYDIPREVALKRANDELKERRELEPSRDFRITESVK